VRHLGCLVLLLDFSLRFFLLLSLLRLFFLGIVLFIFLLLVRFRFVLLLVRFRFVLFVISLFLVLLVILLFSISLRLFLVFFLDLIISCLLDLCNDSLNNFSSDLGELEDVRAVQLKAERDLRLGGVFLDGDGVVSDFCELIKSVSSEEFSDFFPSGVSRNSFYLDLHGFVIAELDGLLLSEVVLLVLVQSHLLLIGDRLLFGLLLFSSSSGFLFLLSFLGSFSSGVFLFLGLNGLNSDTVVELRVVS